MRTENVTLETTAEQTPQVFMQSIGFNDGTDLPLQCNSIVVFTGANNRASLKTKIFSIMTHKKWLKYLNQILKNEVFRGSQQRKKSNTKRY